MGVTRQPLVLLVDDVPTNLDVLIDQLSNENIDIRVALSGEEGKQLAHELQPDLILLDVMMPGLDGFSVCAQLKQDPKLTDIPVIFLTAKGDEEEVERGFALGGVDFINKPFSLPILKARVRCHLALKRKSDLLEQMACTDGLTQIPNRRHFDTALNYEWGRSLRYQRPLSMLIVDVDHFKNYNDHYGHMAGDDCLRAVAQALKGALSRRGDLVARYGGEEFVVLLPETNAQGARQVAERLRMCITELGLAAPTGGVVSVSIGVACAQAKKGSAEHLLKAADEQLYEAKASGRNQVCG